MVATIKMFQFSANDKARVADVAGYYVDSTNMGYYTESGEAPGEWYGSGSMRLNLDGIVTKKALYNLLRGKSANGNKQLVKYLKRKPDGGTDVKPKPGGSPEARKKRKRPTEHMPGFDLTFSAPKDVSALWAISSPEIRLKIERAHDRAVKETISLLERHVPLIRRSKGGSTQEYAHLIVAMFAHINARNEGNPNLHHHCVVPNVAVNNAGEIFKINSQMILEWTRTAGPLYRNNLCVELMNELHVEPFRRVIDGKKCGWFALKGVPEKLTDFWSSRTKEINSEVELLGGHSSDVVAQKAANLRTRRAKEELPNRQKLHEQWLSEAKDLGVTPESISKAMGRTASINIEKRVSLAMDEAVKTITSKHSTFSRRELIQAFSEAVQDIPIKGEQVIQLVDHALAHSKELISVHRNNGVAIFTTKSMWEMEEDVIQMIDKLSTTPGLQLSDRKIEKAIKSNPQLTDEQKVSVRHVLSSEGSIACMTGVAGSGKSTTLAVIARAYEAQGKRVVGISLSGVAAENLELKTSVPSRTIESFLRQTEKSMAKRAVESTKHHLKMLIREAADKSTWTKNPSFSINKNTVVLLDEAGMADTEYGRRILRQIDRVGAKIIAVGDLEQLTPIGAGRPFSAMIGKVGTAHLAENFRMKNDPLGLEAAAHIREGRIVEALAIYADKGDLKILGNRTDAAKKLVLDWASDGGIRNPEQAMILVQTRPEAKTMNRMCQKARLLESAISNVSTKIGDREFHINDRVMFQETARAIGIENGNKGVVVGITERGDMRIRLDKQLTKEQIKRGIKQEQLFKSSEIKDGFIELGYAATTHKVQSIDIPKGYFLCGGSMTNRNLAYVAASRSTEKTKIYIDRDHAGPELSAIVKSMEKRVDKPMAHEQENARSFLRIERNLEQP